MSHNSGKVGVFVINLGTPDAPTTSAVRKYLIEFLMDSRVVDYNWFVRTFVVRGIIGPFRSPKSAKAYRKVWTKEGSPLKIYGENVCEKLQSQLGSDYEVVLGMRYQHPSIEAGLKSLIVDKKVSKIIILPLFPQYASATTGSVYEEVMRCLTKYKTIPNLSFINSYPTEPAMIKRFADNAREKNYEEFDHYLFSFHGVPARQITNSLPNHNCQMNENCCANLHSSNQFCYTAQCYATSKAIAQELNIPEEKYSVAFQSRLGPEEWLKPYTAVRIQEIAESGRKKLLVFSPAFVADCLETTIEIGDEYKEEFEHKYGGEKLELVESLNDRKEWIDCLAEMVLRN